jgi:hypothetical protein
MSSHMSMHNPYGLGMRAQIPSEIHVEMCQFSNKHVHIQCESITAELCIIHMHAYILSYIGAFFYTLNLEVLSRYFLLIEISCVIFVRETVLLVVRIDSKARSHSHISPIILCTFISGVWRIFLINNQLQVANTANQLVKMVSMTRRS